MLTIGEFSNICKVSTKTLRHYAKIGLLLPSEINHENGYRYYAIQQLETMLLINRLKTYHFSLDEIKEILYTKHTQSELLYNSIYQKKEEIEAQLHRYEKTIEQLNQDLISLAQGKSIMSYLDDISIQLVEVPMMNLVYVRKTIQKNDFEQAYKDCFYDILNHIQKHALTMVAPPMVLFHDKEFQPAGLDTEFAIPVKEYATKTRDFNPGLCIKTTLHGSYENLTSVYTKQIEWAQQEGFEASDALYEVYVNDPSTVEKEEDLITEIYYPVRKKKQTTP